MLCGGALVCCPKVEATCAAIFGALPEVPTKTCTLRKSLRSGKNALPAAAGLFDGSWRVSGNRVRSRDTEPIGREVS
jgi:hypothetical protein